MKKMVSVCLILAIISSAFVGCGNIKAIDGNLYDTYGILNESDMKNPDVEYRLIIGNVVWGILLVETLIAPVYFFGFSLYEPVCKKDSNRPKGVVKF